MMSLVTSCRWIIIGQHANLIDWVTDVNFIAPFIGAEKLWLLFCHTTIYGATTKTGTSTVYYGVRLYTVILLPAHPASFAHKFLFQRVPGCNSIADLSLKIVI